MALPKILVISSTVLNHQTGVGVTMGNLLGDWPADGVAQIHSDVFNTPDQAACRDFHFIPVYRQTDQDQGRVRRFATEMRMLMDGVAGIQRTRIAVDWAKRMRPDVIYAVPSGFNPLYWRLPRQLGRELGIPYVAHIMDNWPGLIEFRGGYLKSYMENSIRTLISDAAATLGISEEMCAAYESRFDRAFVPFHNCVEVADWPVHVPDDDKPFTVVYVGVMTRDKELQSLIDIRNAVVDIGRRQGGIRFVIYSSETYRDTIRLHMEELPWVHYGGYVPMERYKDALAAADLLVLPINFDERSASYAGYSLQTKVPEYMACRTPILAYGPPSSPNIRYAEREGWAHVVNQRSNADLKTAIRMLMDDSEARRKIADRARELAETNHDSAIVRQRFREMILKASAGP